MAAVAWCCWVAIRTLVLLPVAQLLHQLFATAPVKTEDQSKPLLSMWEASVGFWHSPD